MATVCSLHRPWARAGSRAPTPQHHPTTVKRCCADGLCRHAAAKRTVVQRSFVDFDAPEQRSSHTCQSVAGSVSLRCRTTGGQAARPGSPAHPGAPARPPPPHQSAKGRMEHLEGKQLLQTGGMQHLFGKNSLTAVQKGGSLRRGLYRLDPEQRGRGYVWQHGLPRCRLGRGRRSLQRLGVVDPTLPPPGRPLRAVAAAAGSCGLALAGFAHPGQRVAKELVPARQVVAVTPGPLAGAVTAPLRGAAVPGTT